MRIVKSLHFHKPDGKDIPQHRTHRSKKGRNNWNIGSNFAVFLYKKRKKEEKFDEMLEESKKLTY